MMKPSPPNRPTPIFFWNAMPIEMPFAAHRKESFWQISSPPSCFMSIARIRPGKGAAKATFSLRPPWAVNTVMKRLSPVRMRLPAPSRAPIRPFACVPLPSPKIVSIWMPCVMYMSAPASATTLSFGSSSTTTNCRSSPTIS